MEEMEAELATLHEAYVAAHENAIVVDRSNLGLLKFTGETRLDLLQRMSTGDVLDLQSGEGAATILTTDIGRMVDRLLLYASSDAVYALTGEENADNVARYLMRFVFFQDDFHIEDLTAATAVFGVYGQQTEARLRDLFDDRADLALHHWRERKLGDATVYVHRTDAVAGGGAFVMSDQDDAPAVWQRLVGAGLTPATGETFDYLCIESELPRFGREITGDYIPLEAGLWRDVSFSKGCYIGQEIIARMESRGRLAKQLVRLESDEPVARGAEVQAEGRNTGTITSAGDGPAGPQALAYIKTRALDEDGGVALTAADMPLRLAGIVRR
jgi:aminomethyltransferase